MKHAARALVGISAAALATALGMATAQAAPAQYNNEDRTCDVEDAGTDARVEISMNGSSWINLDNPGDDRERGKTDRYNFTLTSLGPISSVAIAFDNKGDSPHWCLEEVVVRGPNGVTIHPLHNWLRQKYTKVSPLNLPAA